ncbi:hypothetical protein OROMI_014582 [Orobanche minor]
MNWKAKVIILVGLYMTILRLRMKVMLLWYYIVRQRQQSRKRKRSKRYSMVKKIPKQIEHLSSLVREDDIVCIEQLRMDRNASGRLCQILRNAGGLQDEKYVSVTEQVALFLHILAHHKKNVSIKHYYKRSGATVSLYINRTLDAFLRLYRMFLAHPEPITEDSIDPVWRYFPGCLGAIDGTRVKVRVPLIVKNRYRSRKGCFYLGDGGYANCEGSLTPYRGIRYHLSEWGEGDARPRNYKEYFNLRHAKARNIIERWHGMDNQTGMQIPQERLGRGRRQKAPKRFWSKKEEIICIGVVKELIKGGWRSGNGWRGGFYGAVKDEMKSIMPECTLVEVHVNSKLTVWKREWIMVADVANLSGFSWDHASSMILPESKELWDSLIKSGKEVDKIRGNAFPYYEDWCEIFGKDRATGEKACDFAMNEKRESVKRSADKMEGEKISRSKGKDKIYGYDTYFTDCYFVQDEDGDSDHVNIVSPTAGGGNKKNKSGNSGVVDDSLNATMDSFMNDTKEALLGLNKSIEKLCDGNPNAARAMAALKNIPSLSQVLRIEVAEKLMDKPNHLQFFVAMDDDDQFGYVKNILRGRF